MDQGSRAFTRLLIFNRGNCKTLDRTVAASATGAVTAGPLAVSPGEAAAKRSLEVCACRGGRDSTGFCNYLDTRSGSAAFRSCQFASAAKQLFLPQQKVPRCRHPMSLSQTPYAGDSEDIDRPRNPLPYSRQLFALLPSTLCLTFPNPLPYSHPSTAKGLSVHGKEPST